MKIYLNITKIISGVMYFGMTVNIISCTTIYKPQIINVPVIKNSGDIQFGGYSGINGLHCNGTMALSKFQYSQVNALLIKGKGSPNGIAAEVDYGIFKNVKNILIPSISLGLGQGYTWGNAYIDSISNTGYIPIDTLNVSVFYSKIILQENIMFVLKYFEIGLSFKQLYLDIMKYKFDKNTNFKIKNGFVNEIVYNLAVGGERMKIFIQTGFSLPQDIIEGDHVAFMSNMGLTYKIK